MKYVLGIDQGSSQTRAAICDRQGRIHALAISPGACHQNTGMAKAMQMVHDATQTAINRDGISPDDIGILFGGLTGVDWPDEYDLIRDNILRLGFTKEVRVVNDSIIAMRGGTSTSSGAIVIAGTGGNCAIRNPNGDEFLYHFYQEDALQGGTALGRQVLVAIYRAETGREQPTLLTAHVLDFFHCCSVDQLLREDVEHRLPQDKIKDLAPILFEAAYAGDAVACKIIRTFGKGLGELVTSGLTRMGMTQMEVEVVLSGSIFKCPGTLLEDAMALEIHSVAPRACLVNSRFEPVVGALLLGLEATEVPIDEGVRTQIEASCQAFGLIRR